MAKCNSKTEDKVKAIIETAVSYVCKNGTPMFVENVPGKAIQLKHDKFMFVYSTPFTRLETLPGIYENYGLDIWVEGEGKVLSVWWEPFDLRCFKNGEWVNKVLQL